MKRASGATWATWAMRWLFVGLLALVAQIGCKDLQTRPQSDDEESEPGKTADAQTVGDYTTVMGLEEVPVFGVGVVVGLEGTGSDPQPDEYRQQAIHYLKQRGVEDPIAFLARSDTAVVRVTAILPPGVRKDEPVDVYVELAPRDKATSLKGGTLMECELRQHADAHALRGGEGPHASVRGKVLARAKGPLTVGLGASDDKDRLRRGRIWSGGKSLIDRDFALMLRGEGDPISGAKRAKLLADRINDVFNGPFRGHMRGVAEPKSDRVITLRIPEQYRLNVPRYLRVIRHVPARESASVLAPYKRKLGDQLIDPALAVAAALKLEALGSDSVAALKRGLQETHPLVRFCSAEALAYLGDPACGEPLAELIQSDPRFHAYGLTALASLNEAVCGVKLRELMAARGTEARYGAFCALRALDEHDAALGEERFNGGYSLHRVVPGSTPLIHVSATRRAEVVLFGQGHKLLPPFTLLVGTEFLVSAAEDATGCTVKRVAGPDTVHAEPCTLSVEEIIRTMAGLGANYPEIVELIREADRRKNLSCPVAIDAVPRAPSVYALALSGAREKSAADKEEDSTEDVAMNGTPNLFARDNTGRR